MSMKTAWYNFKFWLQMECKVLLDYTREDFERMGLTLHCPSGYHSNGTPTSNRDFISGELLEHLQFCDKLVQQYPALNASTWMIVLKSLTLCDIERYGLLTFLYNHIDRLFSGRSCPPLTIDLLTGEQWWLALDTFSPKLVPPEDGFTGQQAVRVYQDIVFVTSRYPLTESNKTRIRGRIRLHINQTKKRPVEVVFLPDERVDPHGLIQFLEE